MVEIVKFPPAGKITQDLEFAKTMLMALTAALAHHDPELLDTALTYLHVFKENPAYAGGNQQEAIDTAIKFIGDWIVATRD